MKILIILILISFCQTDILSKRCSRPDVKRYIAFIYKTMPTVRVKVLRCLFNDTINAYSDISNNCINAFDTGTFRDKYDKIYNIADQNTPIVLEEYIAPADPLGNNIFLRSGITCRYDRGFCYDVNETISYAAVWNVVPILTEKCPENIQLVFHGPVDVWSFILERKHYLFFNHQILDKAFALKLTYPSKCKNKDVWFDEEKGYIVYLKNLKQYSEPVLSIKENFCPQLKPKRIISEAILKDCDLSAYFVNVDEQIQPDHLVDPQNIKTVLQIYQRHIFNITERKITNQTTFFEQKLKFFNYSLNLVFKNYKDLFDKIKTSEASNFNFEKIYLNINNLKSNVDSLNKFVKNLETIQITFRVDIKKYQKEIEQTVLNNYNNLSYFIQTELNNLHTNNTKIEQNVFNKFNLLTESLKKDTNICLLKIENLKQDTNKSMEHLIDQFNNSNILIINKITTKVNDVYATILQNIKNFTLTSDLKIKEFEDNLKNSFDSIDNYKRYFNDSINNLINTFNLHLNNKFLNNEEKVNRSLKVLKDSIENRLNNYLKQIGIFKDNIDNSITTTEQKIKICCRMQTNFLNDINKVNNSLSTKLFILQHNILQITDDLYKWKKEKNGTDIAIENELKNIQKTITNIYQTINKVNKNSDNEISKKFSHMSSNITNCLQSIQNVNHFIKDLKHNLSQLTTIKNDVYNTINNLKLALANKLNIYDLKLEQLENKLIQFKFEQNNIKKFHNLESDKIRHNISLFINKRLKEEMSLTIWPQLKSLSNKIDVCQKDIENLKNINNSISSRHTFSEECINILAGKITKYQKNSETFKNLLELKFVELVENVTNSIPPAIENKISKKLDTKLIVVNDKIKNCLDGVNNINQNFNKSIDAYKQNFYKIFITKDDNIFKNIYDKLNEYTTNVNNDKKLTIPEFNNIKNILGYYNTSITLKISAVEKIMRDIKRDVEEKNKLTKFEIISNTNEIKKLKNNISNKFLFSSNISHVVKENVLQQVTEHLAENLLRINNTLWRYIASLNNKILDIETKLDQQISKYGSTDSQSTNFTNNVTIFFNNSEGQNAISEVLSTLNNEPKKFKGVENVSSQESFSFTEFSQDNFDDFNLKLTKKYLQATDIKKKLEELFDNKASTTSYVSTLEKKVKNISKLENDVDLLRNNIERDQQTLQNLEKNFKQLRQNITSCNCLKEIDDSFKHWDKKHNESVKKFEKLLKEKDNKINRLEIYFNKTVEAINARHVEYDDVFKKLFTEVY